MRGPRLRRSTAEVECRLARGPGATVSPAAPSSLPMLNEDATATALGPALPICSRVQFHHEFSSPPAEAGRSLGACEVRRSDVAGEEGAADPPHSDQVSE